MGDCPDRAHGFPSYVKGNQQRFFQQGPHISEVGKVDLGMGTYLRGVAVQDRAAGAEVTRGTLVSVGSPLPGDGTPVKAFLLVTLLQEAEPGRMRVAQSQRGLREHLQ